MINLVDAHLLVIVITACISIINLVDNEIYDYIYIIFIITLAFIIVFKKDIHRTYQPLLHKFERKNLKSKFIKYLIMICTLAFSLRYLSSVSKITIIVLLLILYAGKYKYLTAKTIYFLSAFSFILEFAKTPKLLTDYFHPLYISDEIYAYVNDKKLFTDYQSQYTSVLGFPFKYISRTEDIYQAVNLSFLYLIILQILCLLILIYILKKVSGNQFKYSLILLFAIIAGPIWGDIYTISDFFQELPARKIFPLIVIALLINTLEKISMRDNKKLYIYLFTIGIIVGISVLNDFIFSSLNAIALLVIYLVSRKELKLDIRYVATISIGTLVTILVALTINKVTIKHFDPEIILGYVKNYDQSVFGVQFNPLGPDVFFISFAILGLIVFKFQLLSEKVERPSETFLLGYLSLLLILTSVYWAGRSFEVQIVASAGVYFTLIFGLLLNYLNRKNVGIEYQKLLILFAFLSPIIFGLLNFSHVHNNLNRIFKIGAYTYLDFNSFKSQSKENEIKVDISIIEKQLQYLIKYEIQNAKDVTYIGDYGNLVSNKYNFFSGNVLNDPSSITDVKIMKIICENSIAKKTNFLILDSSLQNLFNGSYECNQYYRLIVDKKNAFPRYYLYKKR
jgi:hypothetical protein